MASWSSQERHVASARLCGHVCSYRRKPKPGLDIDADVTGTCPDTVGVATPTATVPRAAHASRVSVASGVEESEWEHSR